MTATKLKLMEDRLRARGMTTEIGILQRLVDDRKYLQQLLSLVYFSWLDYEEPIDFDEDFHNSIEKALKE